MTVKLKDLYKTKYFYVTFAIDLNYLFNSIIGIQNKTNLNPHAGSELMEQIFEEVRNGRTVVFDLANAKFTPDTVGIITAFQRQGIKFTDSADIGRTRIIQYNETAIYNSALESVQLPDYDGNMRISEYIQSLNKGMLYHLPPVNKDMYLHMVYMILVLRPSIGIKLESDSEKFFSFIANYFTVDDLRNYDKFYFTSDNGVTLIEFRNGTTTLQGNKVVSIEGALEHGSLVPAVLGKERLYKQEPWTMIFNQCNRMISEWRNNQSHSVSEFIHKEENV